MRRTILLLVFVGWFLCRQCAYAISDNAIVKKTTDNGLSVVIKPEPGSGLVSIVTFIKAGVGQESIQNGGIGNYVAQLLLASTRVSSADEVAAVADEVGGNVDVQWRPDFASLRVVTSSSMYSRAMRLIGECLSEASFEDEWVSKARKSLMSNNTLPNGAFDSAYNTLRGLIYDDNGYKRPTVGFERTIRVATSADLQRFYGAYYVPNNMVVSIVGDITVDQAMKGVDRAFSGLSPRKLPISRPIPYEKLDASRSAIIECEGDSAYILVGFLAPSVGDADYAAMAVTANALGGGKGSLMFREIRQKAGVGYDIGAIYPRLANQSHLVAYLQTDPFKDTLAGVLPQMAIDDARKLMLAQVARLKEAQLSSVDIARAKGYTIGSYALTHQHLIDRAFDLAWAEAIGGDYRKYLSFSDDVEKVTAQDVMRVARHYLDNYAVVVAMPRVAAKPE